MTGAVPGEPEADKVIDILLKQDPKLKGRESFALAGVTGKAAQAGDLCADHDLLAVDANALRAIHQHDRARGVASRTALRPRSASAISKRMNDDAISLYALGLPQAST